MSNPNKDRVFSLEFPDNPGFTDEQFIKLAEKAFDIGIKFQKIFWLKVYPTKIIEHVKLIPRYFSLQMQQLIFDFRIVINAQIIGEIEVTGSWNVDEYRVDIAKCVGNTNRFFKIKTSEQAAEALISEISACLTKKTESKKRAGEQENNILDKQTKAWS